MFSRFYRHVRSSGSAELVATPRDVLQDKLASLSPWGHERAAGPTCVFLARARFVLFLRFYMFLSSRLAFGAGGVGYDTAGRAAVGICVDRRDTKAADGGVVGSCGLTAPLRASALGGFSFPLRG